MVIGVIGWELEIFGCQSLKEKRSVVKGLVYNPMLEQIYNFGSLSKAD